MTTCPRSPHFNVDDRCIAKTIISSSSMSSVYACVDSSLDYTTLKWGKGGGGNPGHGCAWHMEQDMRKVNATLKWGKGVEENLLSLLRMAHRARHSNSQRKIRFPDYLSQGWTRIFEVLILWTWVIHLTLRSRASDVTRLHYSQFLSNHYLF